MKLRVRAPATSANLGSGFDFAGVAFELWNEMEVEDDPDAVVDEEHLAVQAFSLYASPKGRSFSFVDRIPRERGLGSSAAVVALGLVGGALAAGLEPEPVQLLATGLALEGHADNLAAALAGGVCFTWDGRIARLADRLPAEAIAVIPQNRVRTAESRGTLPRELSHADAVFSATRAALLGAAVAGGSAELLAASADDRLHEPYRLVHAPHLQALRDDLPDGALGATLSGSGPTVIVWAERARVADVAFALEERFPDHDVMHLPVTSTGAGPL